MGNIIIDGCIVFTESQTQNVHNIFFTIIGKIFAETFSSMTMSPSPL